MFSDIPRLAARGSRLAARGSRLAARGQDRGCTLKQQVPPRHNSCE